MERPLWEPRAEVQLDLQPILMAAGAPETAILQLLYQQFSIDETLLQRQIETLLESQPRCTLSEVLDRFPPQKGLAEIIGYLSIAAGDTRHQIDPTTRDAIVLPALADATPRVMTVPRVIFRSHYAS
jgi:hypothetical protein